MPLRVLCPQEREIDARGAELAAEALAQEAQRDPQAQGHAEQQEGADRDGQGRPLDEHAPVDPVAEGDRRQQEAGAEQHGGPRHAARHALAPGDAGPLLEPRQGPVGAGEAAQVAAQEPAGDDDRDVDPQEGEGEAAGDLEQRQLLAQVHVAPAPEVEAQQAGQRHGRDGRRHPDRDRPADRVVAVEPPPLAGEAGQDLLPRTSKGHGRDRALRPVPVNLSALPATTHRADVRTPRWPKSAPPRAGAAWAAGRPPDAASCRRRRRWRAPWRGPPAPA